MQISSLDFTKCCSGFVQVLGGCRFASASTFLTCLIGLISFLLGFFMPFRVFFGFPRLMRICFLTFLGQEVYMMAVILAGLGAKSQSYLELYGCQVGKLGLKRCKYSSLLCVNNYKVLSRLTKCSVFQAVLWKQIHLALCISWVINRRGLLNADYISYQ